MAKLGVLEIEGTKYTIKLGESYLIGHKTDDYAHDIEIDDTSVDVKHCILDFTDRPLRLLDIRSKCGTYVDGTRVAGCQGIPIVKSTAIQFGNVESTLQLIGEGDSGYLEGRLTPPAKDNSEVICNSPENVPSSGSRLRNTLKNTLTSTPNATTTTNSTQNTAAPIVEFLIPTKIPRKSVGSNTSVKSVDSFYVPETQCPVVNNDQVSSSTNVSIDTTKSNDKSTNIVNDDDDFFIPETQEVVTATDILSNYPRVAFRNENINETVGDGDKIPSSQFRICTQDFNGSDDELSNNSDDILANVPCSIVIPVIRHDPVQIDDFLNGNKDEEDVEKEMSALQWTKKAGEDAEGSVTPDDIIPADGLITPDLIEGVEEAAKEKAPESKTTNTLNNPDQPTEHLVSEKIDKSVEENDVPPEVTEYDIQPTQVFVKPAALYKSVKSSSLPCDKENIGPKKDDSLFLPATQVFMPPPAKIKPVPLLSPPPLPPSSSSSDLLGPSVHDDDELPPTQVFYAAAPYSSKSMCFSSTLVESGMQLSENSFKAKCNKLLDSDDDEMDEIVAPELVKKMRESLEKAEEPRESLSTETIVPAPEPEEQLKEKRVSKEKPTVTPKEKFTAPATATKKSSRPQPAVIIDNFLFTPDFLGKEFSKDEKLQKLAEVNWKNLISEKQRKSLFGNEDSDGNPLSSESDDSQDSFNDLLPHKEKQKKTVKSAPESKPSKKRQEKTMKPELENIPSTETQKSTTKPEPEKVQESKTSKEPVIERITRRRKSAFPEESKESKIARKDVSEESKESKSNNSELDKKVTKTTTKRESKTPNSVDSKSSNDSTKKKNDLKKSLKETSDPIGRERIKLRRMHHTDKTDQEKAKKVDERKSEEKGISRRSEKPSEITTKVPTRRKTRQSSQELNNTANESAKSKHHNESKDLSHNRPNSTQEKSAVEHRNEFKQKESERKNDLVKAKNHKKTLKHSRKDTVESSSKSLDKKESDWSKKEEPNREKRKTKTRKSKEEQSTSKEVSKVEKEEKPLPRLTRLKSSKQVSTVCVTEINVDLPNTTKVTNKEKGENETRKDIHERPKKETTAKKDHLKSQPSTIIDLTDSEIEDTSIKVPAQIEKSNSAGNYVIEAMTTKNGKRTTGAEETKTKTKRLRSASLADSVITAQLGGSRISRSQTKMKVAMTMCDPRYQEILEKHSGGLWIYTKDPKDCDVLVVEKGNRTYKLMVAIARGAPIVKLDWLKEVLKKKMIEIPFEAYIFEDPLFQERHQFHMKKSLQLAKTTSLFDGISFMMTPGIRPIPDEMKDIIICAGGTVLEHIPKPQAKQRIYLISQPKDNQYWYRFRRTNPNIKIVTSEGVMSSVMQQSETPLIKSTIQ